MMRVRNKYVLILAMVWGPSVGLGVMFHLFVLKPQMQRVTALETELSDARHLYGRATEAAKLETQMRLTETVARLDERISDFVLRPSAAPDLAFEIAELASATAVQSFAMKPRNRERLEVLALCDTIGEKQLDISFVGHFHQFASLLNALERHRPVLFVETFSIRRPRRETSQPETNMQVTVLVEKNQHAKHPDRMGGIAALEPAEHGRRSEWVLGDR